MNEVQEEMKQRVPAKEEPKVQAKNKKAEELDAVLGKKDVKTTMVNQKEMIKTFLQDLKDIGTLQTMLPVARRASMRFKAIQADAQASTMKINGEFYTQPPKLHIANLKKKVHTENEAEVSFSVYETDAEGNKIARHMFADAQDEHGKPVKILSGAEYRIAYDVKEIIKFKQPTEREITPRTYPGGN